MFDLFKVGLYDVLIHSQCVTVDREANRVASMEDKECGSVDGGSNMTNVIKHLTVSH